MISYMPQIYPDELVYSWFARYYVHSGHTAYVFALDDLFENRNMRPDVEFINRLDRNARAAITRTIPMERLILGHTMFPYYRFIENGRLRNALKAMADSGGDAHRLLPVPKRKGGEQNRHIRYCPLCAVQARKSYGEAYWTRQANIQNLDICARHRCRLKNTGVEISGKQSLRLYAAEDEIRDMEPEFVEDGLELEFAWYVTDVFQKPVSMDNAVAIGEFLNSRLERTPYLSARGMMRNARLFFGDFVEFYKDLPVQGLTSLEQMQKIYTGYRWDYFEVCQIAFFLGISVDELTNPKLPEMSQTEIFNDKVKRLYAQGLGCHKIARELGCSPSTVKNANKIKPKAEHDHSVRKGMFKEDWVKVDEEMQAAVRDICERIYHNNGGRPGRVTVYAVCRMMGLPGKRFDYLPECRKLISGYEEKKEVYWAREVAWCYQHLTETLGADAVRWRDIRDATNLRKDNFIMSLAYLNLFVNEDTESKIRNLLP